MAIFDFGEIIATMKDNNKKRFHWSDLWAIVCGVICVLQGWFFLMMFIHNHDGRLWLWLLPDWHTIPQFLLCLSGVVLTVRRFIRKKKGLAYKEHEWIPLIISYAFGILYFIMGFLS